jgi:integrase
MSNEIIKVPTIYDVVLDPRRRGKPYGVRWYVFGRTPSRWFKYKRDAERFHHNLCTAVEKSMRFSPETLLPESWSATTSAQICDLAHQWIQEQFPTWEPATRDSNIEVIAAALLLFVKKNSSLTSDQRATLVSLIRDWLASPLEGNSRTTCPDWLRRSSISVDQIDRQICQSVDSALIRKKDGSTKAAATIQRYRSTVNAFFSWMIANKSISENMWKVERTGRNRNAEKVNTTVETHLLPTPQRAFEMISRMGKKRRTTTPFLILYLLVLLAGLRPGEARALLAEDCTLPDSGWGMLRVRRAGKSGRKRSSAGSPNVGSTKTGVSRDVPITPELVSILKEHLNGRTTGLVVHGAGGKMIEANNLSDAWNATREEDWTLYDMRHVCATAMIQSGMQPSTIAKRLGHSVQELHRTYEGEFAKLRLTGDEEFRSLMSFSALESD